MSGGFYLKNLGVFFVNYLCDDVYRSKSGSDDL